MKEGHLKEAQTITVLNPTGAAATARDEPAPRLETLHAKRIALFWNAKKNGDAVLDGIVAGLSASGLEFESERFRKDIAMRGASEALLRTISERADVVINAVAD